MVLQLSDLLDEVDDLLRNGATGSAFRDAGWGTLTGELLELLLSLKSKGLDLLWIVDELFYG